MPRPAVVLVLLWDRTTARDTACARPGYSGRCWASRAWSSRTSRSRSIRTVTRRSWWCRCVPTPGRRVGVVSAVGGARAMTRGGGTAVADGGHRHHSDVPAVGGAAGAVRGARCAGGGCAVGAAGREVYVPAGGHLRVAGEEHGVECGRGVPAAVLADRHGDRGAGGAGPDRQDRSARRAPQDRDRRDRLS